MKKDKGLKRKVAEIRQFCESNSNPALAQKYAWYFVEGYDAYGLERKLLEEQSKIWLKEYGKELKFEDFLGLGKLLLESGKYEEASFAILFVASFAEQYSAATLEMLGDWPENGFRNWAHTDVFCGMVLKQFFLRKIVKLDSFIPWRESRGKWRRRAVPVSFIEALKAGWPVPDLLRFIDSMMMDPEKAVQQGLGWFLREAWKRDPGRVEKFLLHWKDRCPRIIVQYATEKMTSDAKQRFKRLPQAR
jgi:3-methyladenine DNA glycosylase AlkD